MIDRHEQGNQKGYPDKQITNYAKLLKKIVNNEPIHIVCQGDSMTYGHDTESSDIRPKKSDPTCEEAATYPEHEQAGKTYPEALQEFCNMMYGKGKVTVTNRGYSGDWAEMSKKRWDTNPQADLHFLMLGTNDASNPFIPLQVQKDIVKYIEDMGKLIEQILDFKSAIVLLTPPKHSIDDNLLIVAYRQALKLLGKKYTIPVIDSTEFLEGYPIKYVQSDEVHYNTKGYTIFAAKVASLLAGISHVYDYFTIDSNQLMVPSFTKYGVAMKNNNSKMVTLEEHLESINDTDSGIPNKVVYHIPSRTSLTISFNANRQNLVLTPLFEILNEQGIINFKVDFGIDSGNCLSNDLLYIHTKNHNSVKPIKNILTFNGITSQVNLHNKEPLFILNNSLHLSTKGFYSIIIENTSLVDEVYVSGFIVKTYESYIS